MNPSSFIAGRLRFRGHIAMAAIAISFLVMIVAVAISSGFRHAVRDGISAVAGDIQITPSDLNYVSESSPIPLPLPSEAEILRLRGVREVTPAVYRAGIVKSGEVIHGVMVKGTPARNDSALTVSIPSRLAALTGLQEGDDMLTYFAGEKVKVRKFKVQEVYRSMLELNDNLIVYAGLADMQRLNGWTAEEASAIEVSLLPRFRGEADLIAEDIGSLLMLSGEETQERLRATSVQRHYPELFDWLDLLDFNVLFILILMTLVAGFNMISGLLILLFQHISTIGTLKTLGMTDRSIAAVFLKVASVLVLKGMAIGNGLALLFCLVQGATHCIRLNPANYFVSYVPVHIPFLYILAADCAAFALILLLLLLPSLFISRIDPADTVRVK